MLRVIILEDEDIIRRGLVCTLDWQAMGCVVVGDAADGRQGLELIARTQPDVVLTDIRMPCLDGLQLAEKLRQDGSAVHIIFLTSYADFSYAKRAIEVQAADYLLKPVDEKELANLLQRLQRMILVSKKVPPQGWGRVAGSPAPAPHRLLTASPQKN